MGQHRRQLRRSQFLAFFEGLPRCLVGMEACAGAHHWGRQLQEMGHDVRLMPPSYVKPYVKRGKTDAADVAAICEAVTRPSMRFVAVKSEAASAVIVLHRVRDFLVRQVTQTGNAIRAHMAEFGIVAAKGAKVVEGLASELDALPEAARLPIEPVFATDAHRPFILPMSGRSWRFNTAGTLILARRFAFAALSSGRQASSSRYRVQRTSS